MSYDVYVGGSDKSFNYTSNLGEMLYDHIPDNGKGGVIRELHETCNREVVAIIGNFFESIRGEHKTLSKYDAPNGWGTHEGMMIFMARIMAEAAKNPDNITTIST